MGNLLVGNSNKKNSEKSLYVVRTLKWRLMCILTVLWIL